MCSELRGDGRLQRCVLRGFLRAPPRDQRVKVALELRLFQFLKIRAAGNAVWPFNASRGTDVVADPKALFARPSSLLVPDERAIPVLLPRDRRKWFQPNEQVAGRTGRCEQQRSGDHYHGSRELRGLATLGSGGESGRTRCHRGFGQFRLAGMETLEGTSTVSTGRCLTSTPA